MNVFRSVIFVSLFLAATCAVFAQTDASGNDMYGREKEDPPRTFQEMMLRQRLKKEKKDYEDLVKRGEEAARLTGKLEDSFATKNTFSSQDRATIDSLEKVVLKIRDELGGNDDDDPDSKDQIQRPSNLKEALNLLQNTTTKLVDEIKRSSRFTVSAVAIQSSNTVIKIVRFLKLKK